MSEENLVADNHKLARENGINRTVIKLLAGTCLCLGFANIYLVKNQQIIIMPPGATFKDKAVYARDVIDNEGLQPMADFIVNRTLNVTPDNVLKNLQTILYLVSPDFYGTYKAQLETQAQYIKMNNICQSFEIQKTDIQKDKIVVYGLLKRSVGQSDAPVEEAVLEINYAVQNSKFSLTGLTRYDKKTYSNLLITRKAK